MDLAEEEMRNTLGKGGTELLGNEKSKRGTGHERDRFYPCLPFSKLTASNLPPHPPYSYFKSPLKVQYYDTALLEVRTSGPLTIPISKGSLGVF